MRIAVERKWTEQTLDRECGKCTACCIYLGIEELKKPTAVKCKHLRGAVYGSKRCGIYPGRPVACREYKCVWREGWGPDNLQPNKSGMLITFYDIDSQGENNLCVTINVFDAEKAMNCKDEVVGELIMLPGMKEVRLNFIQSKKGMLYRDGVIHIGRMIYKPNDVESFGFEAERIVGSYTGGTEADLLKE